MMMNTDTETAWTGVNFIFYSQRNEYYKALQWAHKLLGMNGQMDALAFYTIALGTERVVGQFQENGLVYGVTKNRYRENMKQNCK